VPLSLFFVFIIIKTLSLYGILYFGNSQKSFGAKLGIGWVFHFSNRFLGQKLLDREHLVSRSIVILENPIVRPKFRPFSMHSFIYPLHYFHIISLADWPCEMNSK
jgi:hypothetical protein